MIINQRYFYLCFLNILVYYVLIRSTISSKKVYAYLRTNLDYINPNTKIYLKFKEQSADKNTHPD